jgi:hypothetical protein
VVHSGLVGSVIRVVEPDTRVLCRDGYRCFCELKGTENGT